MINREYLESQPNWICTIERNSPGVRDKFDCLMSTVTGGYYWHTPDYKGIYAWGATREFHKDISDEFLQKGYFKVVKGVFPQ